MAWQVLLLRLPDAMTKLSTLPADYVAPTLGSAEEVAERIQLAAKRACVIFERVALRGVVLRNEDFVIEAELEETAVLLRVLGSDAAIPLVCALAQVLDASAIDCETDIVLDADTAVPDTLRQWQTRIDALR